MSLSFFPWLLGCQQVPVRAPALTSVALGPAALALQADQIESRQVQWYEYRKDPLRSTVAAPLPPSLGYEWSWSYERQTQSQHHSSHFSSTSSARWQRQMLP